MTNTQGLRHGYGRQTYGGHAAAMSGDGDVYEGEWREGKRCGQGKLTLADGAEYNGEWFDDEKHGSGLYEYTNGSRYVGVWVNGVAKTGEYEWHESEQQEFPKIDLCEPELVIQAAKNAAAKAQ